MPRMSADPSRDRSQAASWARAARLTEMQKILLTGMSGTGKSTALIELARRGFDVVDTDEGDWAGTGSSEATSATAVPRRR